MYESVKANAAISGVGHLSRWGVVLAFGLATIVVACDGEDDGVSRSADVLSKDYNRNSVGHTSAIDRRAEPGDSIADWVVYGGLEIARIRVVSVGPYLYNTPSGELPTPLPSGDWPRSIRHLNKYERVVSVDILEVLSGDLSNLSGLVLIEEGTPPPGVRHYAITSAGFGDPNSEGVLFATIGMSGQLRSIPTGQLVPRMADAQAQLFALGAGYEFAIASNFYRYEGSDAISEIDGRTVTISELESDIEAASSGIGF